MRASFRKAGLSKLEDLSLGDLVDRTVPLTEDTHSRTHQVVAAGVARAPESGLSEVHQALQQQQQRASPVALFSATVDTMSPPASLPPSPDPQGWLDQSLRGTVSPTPFAADVNGAPSPGRLEGQAVAAVKIPHAGDAKRSETQRVLPAPPDAKKLNSIVQLDLRQNRLSSLHGISRCAHHIVFVGCQGCAYLCDVYVCLSAPVVLRFSNLRSLDISYNELACLSEEVVQELPSGLTSLDVSHNGIEVLPMSLSRLTSLMDLSAGFNLLSGVRRRAFFPRVTLSDGVAVEYQVMTVPSIPTLRSLSLFHNELEEVRGFASLPKLDSLDLRRNCIAMHAGLAAISACTTLRKLVVKGNPIEECPCYRFTWYANSVARTKSAMLCSVCGQPHCPPTLTTSPRVTSPPSTTARAVLCYPPSFLCPLSPTQLAYGTTADAVGR